jgi:hypothetical protein
MRKKRRVYDKNGPPEPNYANRTRITSHYNRKERNKKGV